MSKKNNDKYKIDYDAFLASVYDDAPTFGRWRNRNLIRINKPYIDAAKLTDGRILEFGTATGMLTIPLACEGFQVSSVDISHYMHEIVRKKLKVEKNWVSENINLINGNALDYSSDRLFDMVVIPDGLFIAISNQKLQLQFLKNCHRNLRKGGRLYFDFATPMTVITPMTEYLCHNGSHTVYLRFQSRNGDRYMITLNVETDSIEQCCDFKYEFTKVYSERNEQPLLVNISYRFVHYGELMLMLQHSGFKVISIDTEYYDGKFFFVIAEKV